MTTPEKKTAQRSERSATDLKVAVYEIPHLILDGMDLAPMAPGVKTAKQNDPRRWAQYRAALIQMAEN